MKVYYKSSNRIKNIANAGQILPSYTPTDAFPHDAATVVLTQAKNQFPNFRLYLRGKEKHSTAQSPPRPLARRTGRTGCWARTSAKSSCQQYSYSSVTRVDLNYHNNEYITSFYGGGIPLDKLSETMQLVKDIKDSVINNKPLSP